MGHCIEILIQTVGGRLFNRKKAVKEGCDNLPMGICFAAISGEVLLINRVMQQLSHTLTGEALQNAQYFWKIIAQGTLKNDALRMQQENVQQSKEKNQYVLRLANDRYWTFTRKKLDIDGQHLIELTAADTTDLYELICRQQADNEALKQIQKRLLAYQKQICQTAKEEELLATKIRIHDQFGKVLLHTRYVLSEKMPNESEMEQLLSSWKELMELFRMQQENKEQKDPFDYVKQTAQAVGVQLVFEGEFPTEATIRRIAVMAASEALTNAVRHAGAHTLWITGQKEGKVYQLCFRNDGRQPEKKPEPAGGIASLAKRAEQAGGKVWMEFQPQFCLYVELTGKNDREEMDEGNTKGISSDDCRG